MNLDRALALAERAAAHCRRVQTEFDLRPTAANLERLRTANEAERAAWARAQRIEELQGPG